MSQILLLASVAFVIWFVRRDRAWRPGLSGAIWIPTLWVAILASRPLSAWLGLSGGDTLEGSPLDRLFFFGMIFASFVVLSRRATPWGPILSRNWPIVLFYLFLLVTVVWANSPLSSFKRWSKECGNIVVALVILTEVDPQQAIRAVFVRCASVLVPLSIVFIRYFPDLGRRYSMHSGELEITGVTTQKNSLGAMILVCGLVLIWDWLERSRPGAARVPRLDRCFSLGLFAAAAWLLYQSDSKTSMACLVVGGGLIAAVRLPVLHRRVSAMGPGLLVAGILFFLCDQAFGLSAAVISNLGRDMTLTGRTEVWRELLNLNTDPLFGTGFMSLWDDPQLRGRLPEWVAGSAHNGYLEIYLASGLVGVALLALMLLVTGLRINQALRTGGSNFAAVRFAVLLAMVVANYFESNFACMTPLGLLFLVSAIGEVPRGRTQSEPREEPAPALSPQADAGSRFSPGPGRAPQPSFPS